MRIPGQAQPWEFRWRTLILFGSLPVCALLFALSGLSAGQWDAPSTAKWQQVAAAISASAGLILRVWGADALSVSQMNRLQPQGKTLVESGPFAVVRNPLYLGTMLIICGWSVLYGWLPATLFTVFQTLRYYRIVAYEESSISVESGGRFDEYCSRVPRWLPKLSRLTKAGWPRTNIAAVLSNAPFVAMTIALWIIVGTERSGLFFPLMLAGLMVAAAFILIHNQRREDSFQAPES